MFIQFRTALAVVFVASVPLHLGANVQGTSFEPLTSKEVRRAEVSAKTAADHLRLAAWYRLEAQQAQRNLAEQEAVVNQLSHNPALVARTKIQNPYWNAQAWTRIYREKLQNATKLAAAHQKMADSLQ
jgi:hypothetical protein